MSVKTSDAEKLKQISYIALLWKESRIDDAAFCLRVCGILNDYGSD